MILFKVAAKPTVAGDKDGAGAADVELERDVAERDLSRKSTSACIETVNDRER